MCINIYTYCIYTYIYRYIYLFLFRTLARHLLPSMIIAMPTSFTQKAKWAKAIAKTGRPNDTSNTPA